MVQTLKYGLDAECRRGAFLDQKRKRISPGSLVGDRRDGKLSSAIRRIGSKLVSILRRTPAARKLAWSGVLTVFLRKSPAKASSTRSVFDPKVLPVTLINQLTHFSRNVPWPGEEVCQEGVVVL